MGYLSFPYLFPCFGCNRWNDVHIPNGACALYSSNISNLLPRTSYLYNFYGSRSRTLLFTKIACTDFFWSSFLDIILIYDFPGLLVLWLLLPDSCSTPFVSIFFLFHTCYATDNFPSRQSPCTHDL
ncbi:hypothetical protein K503DRAFT_540292 [Rhizopogon vinicolor AM-OR11-026]|uniref:Uncharacterized protein n=1 Tax=Rhizopogon vinicolor AM-OR11-026 TaxID=1314800 RepID=A0A1B7MKT1_9AGAM|nr:hypothetical protein K503DRAFT_540292 [Rhizopogon vinicolor AM-OR11-026]